MWSFRFRWVWFESGFSLARALGSNTLPFPPARNSLCRIKRMIGLILQVCCGPGSGIGARGGEGQRSPPPIPGGKGNLLLPRARASEKPDTNQTHQNQKDHTSYGPTIGNQNQYFWGGRGLIRFHLINLVDMVSIF